MNKSLMLQSHQINAPWAWQLTAQQATTVAAERRPRWLLVHEGSVWATAAEGGPDSADIWLCPGDSLALPAGSRWVVQAWPQARLSVVLQAPQALSRGAPAPAAGAWWQRLWPRALAV